MSSFKAKLLRSLEKGNAFEAGKIFPMLDEKIVWQCVDTVKTKDGTLVTLSCWYQNALLVSSELFYVSVAHENDQRVHGVLEAEMQAMFEDEL